MDLLNPLFLSFITALFLAAALSLVLIGYVWPRRSAPGATALLWLLAAVFFWSAGYILEYTAANLGSKLFYFNISYLGIATVPLILLVFTLHITHHSQWMTWRRLILFSIIPAITILLQWTKDFHPFMYNNIHLIQDGPFLLATYQYGFWFWILAAYNYALLLASLWLILYRFFSPPRLFTDQAMYLLIVILVPMAANLEYLIKFIPGPHADWTPCAFAISALAMTMAISRHGFLDVLPIARGSAIELMSEGFLVLDERDRIVDYNLALRNILQETDSPEKGKPLPSQVIKQLRQNSEFNSNTDGSTEIMLTNKEGLRYFSVHFSPFGGGSLQTRGHVLVFYDISERKRMEDAIKHIAYFDQLTGLPNRSLFADRTKLALSGASRHKRKMAIMVIDIDRFKLVNDSFGHISGDEVLQEVTHRLVNSVRKMDTVSRLGGDEFTILLPEISGAEMTDTVAQRIAESFASPFIIEDEEVMLTVSTGIAVYPEDATDMDTLIKCADTAMYQVKRRGRNGYLRYSKDITEQKPENGTIETLE